MIENGTLESDVRAQIGELLERWRYLVGTDAPANWGGVLDSLNLIASACGAEPIAERSRGFAARQTINALLAVEVEYRLSANFADNSYEVTVFPAG